ncbi:unnamed protein product, partial [Oppiella nova]
TKLENDFRQHLIKHSDRFACSECDKRFLKEAHLRHHMRSHDDTLKLRCEWPGCERLFTSKSNFKSHMNTHTGEQVYACEWPGCGKTSLNQKSMLSHAAKAHK